MDASCVQFLLQVYCSHFRRLASFNCDSSIDSSFVLVHFVRILAISHLTFHSTFSILVASRSFLSSSLSVKDRSEPRRIPTARKIDSARWSRGRILKFWQKRKLTDIWGKEYEKGRKVRQRWETRDRSDRKRDNFSPSAHTAIRKKSQTIYRYIDIWVCIYIHIHMNVYECI